MTIEEIEREVWRLVSPGKHESGGRLNGFHSLMQEIREIEQQACKQMFSARVSDLRKIRELIPIISSAINRLEAGKKRSQALKNK